MNDDEELKLIALEFFRKVALELDPYTTENSEIIEEAGEVSLLTPAHIQFAKYGRGPGKRPPLNAILSWVKKKGIEFKNLSQRGTAFAIQKSISEKGTIGYTPNAPNALEEAVDKNYEEYMDESSSHFEIIFNDDVKKIMREAIPIKITIQV